VFDGQKDGPYSDFMKIGYGYRRSEADLTAAGGERVFVDISRERQERADMVAYGLREGDTLILLSLRDLGGAPKADEAWKERIEAMGVEITVAPLPDNKPPTKIGRPRKFDPTPEQAEQIRELWLCWHYTEAYKLRRASEIMGHEVGRGVLFNRYGSMKKHKETKDA
jgi:hypothetical protein